MNEKQEVFHKGYCRRDCRKKPSRRPPGLGSGEIRRREPKEPHGDVLRRKALEARGRKEVEHRHLHARRHDPYRAVLYELREGTAIMRQETEYRLFHTRPIFERSTERSPIGAVVSQPPRVKSGMSTDALRFLTDLSLSSARQHQLARS